MGIAEVKKNIRRIYERRRQALFALSLHYAALAINYFRSKQPATPGAKGAYWTNRTGQAAARMFSNAEISENIVSWFVAHGVQYGVYLELANDRQNEAIRLVIQRFAGRFFQDARKLFRDN
jgi:hypothetical protein